MKKNLTLTFDEDLLLEARKLALDRKTTVNQMVREYLESQVNERKRIEETLEGFRKIWRESKYEIGERTWTRDDIYERD